MILSRVRCALSAAAVAGLCSAAALLAGESYPDNNRIVSIGGAVTEIIYALGEEDRIIARDTTSVFPKDALDLPDVGYMRRLSPEGILSVNPDLILTEPGSGPKETLDIMAEAQIPFVDVAGAYSAAGILDRIHAVAEALGVPEKGNDLAAKVDAQLSAALAKAKSGDTPPRILFILSMTGGRINASGTGTRADGVIEMVGAVNAITDFPQYKILSDEAVITAAPDVILMMKRSNDHGATAQNLWAHPAIALTPAGKNKALVAMDGSLLLGFGPRMPQAVEALTEALSGL